VVLDLQPAKVQCRERLTNGWAVDGMFNFATPALHGQLSVRGRLQWPGEWFGRPDIISNPQAAHSINPSNHGVNLLNGGSVRRAMHVG